MLARLDGTGFGGLSTIFEGDPAGAHFAHDVRVGGAVEGRAPAEQHVGHDPHAPEVALLVVVAR